MTTELEQAIDLVLSAERFSNELDEAVTRLRAVVNPGPEMPDDLKALDGLLPVEEIRTLWKIRLEKETHPVLTVTSISSDDPFSSIAPPPAPVEAVPGLPPCTKPRSGGVHSPARYFLQEDKTVDGQCACGVLLQNVKCPHRHQRLNKRTKAVECEWCGGVIIAGTGTSEPTMDLDSLRFVDPRRFEGTVT